MKTLFHTLLALSSMFIAASAFAAESGSDTARHYKSYPEQFDGQSADVDCAFVTRINRGPQVEGVAFFVAHTVDDDNAMRGGSIVVATLEADAESFVKKYGNVPEIDRKRGQNTTADRVDSKSLSGTFNQLAKGSVYIDYSNGEAHALILEKIEAAKSAIRMGDGIPSTGGKSFKKKKKKL